jgi:hypothetical protein
MSSVLVCSLRTGPGGRYYQFAFEIIPAGAGGQVYALDKAAQSGPVLSAQYLVLHARQDFKGLHRRPPLRLRIVVRGRLGGFAREVLAVFQIAQGLGTQT